MALVGDAFSPKQFQLGFKDETVVGTGVTSSMMLLDVDSVEFPNLAPLQVFDMKQGSGRVFQITDAYIDEVLQTKEISFSGTADATSLPKLLSNITNSAERAIDSGVVPAAFIVTDSFQPATILVGGTSSTIANTCTVAIFAPIGGGDISFPGCRLTSLSISGDISAENGRIKMSGTFSTAMNAATGGTYSSAAWSATKYHMSLFLPSAANFKVANAANPVLQSFSINIENPAQYMGSYTPSKVEPQAISLAIPELSCTYDATMKYDSNTDNLDALWLGGTSVATQMSNNTDWYASDGFGFYSPQGYITSLGYSESTAQMIDVSVKCAATSTGTAPADSLFEIIAD